MQYEKKPDGSIVDKAGNVMPDDFVPARDMNAGDVFKTFNPAGEKIKIEMAEKTQAAEGYLINRSFEFKGWG